MATVESGATATASASSTAATAPGHGGSGSKAVVDPAYIFCNREINFHNLEAIGFDMDYTLAQYTTDFDLLAFNGAREKLVKVMGYPAEALDFTYNPDDFRRGLVLDKQLGNIIKMDRYKYVRVAYHGSRKLTPAERKATYRGSYDRMPNFKGKGFVNLDTLFQLVDASLFSQMVDLKDKLEGTEHQIEKSYFQIYTDVRACVDLCHRDGVIKDEVAINPGKYIIEDPNLFKMLRHFRRSGKKVFLVTNSLYDYTNVVMNYLFNGASKKEDYTEDWLEYFDVAICGSCKPAFLQDPYLSLFRINTAEHTLTNTDGVDCPADEFLAKGKVFQGGNWNHLHAMLELTSGDKLLYVGDHMYGDIIRSKRTLGWRTCLVIPELEVEMETAGANKARYDNMMQLEEQRCRADASADLLRLQLAEEYDGEMEASVVEDCDDDESESDGQPGLTEAGEALADALQTRDELQSQLRGLAVEYHREFHPIWGQIFTAGFQDSRFAKQVVDYACLYTTRASDLVAVSGSREFRAPRGGMPHNRSP